MFFCSLRIYSFNDCLILQSAHIMWQMRGLEHHKIKMNIFTPNDFPECCIENKRKPYKSEIERKRDGTRGRREREREMIKNGNEDTHCVKCAISEECQ